MKFRKKPVIIEAEQFFPDEKPWPKGVQKDQCYCMDLAQDGRYCRNHGRSGRQHYVVRTSKGRILDVESGDWIITGVQGERHPCNPNVFERAYEPVHTVETKGGD